MPWPEFHVSFSFLAHGGGGFGPASGLDEAARVTVRDVLPAGVAGAVVVGVVLAGGAGAAWATAQGCWLLAHEQVVGCDLDEGMGAGGSVHECAV